MSELAIFALSYWPFATFHQSFIFYWFFLQALSPKERDTEMQKAEDRWLNASQLHGTDKLLCPLSFWCECLHPWRKGWTLSLFFSQLKIQVLMEENDLRSAWNCYFRSVLTNWIFFLHIWFQPFFDILKYDLNNPDVPLEMDSHSKMKYWSIEFWKRQMKHSFFFSFLFYFIVLF